MIVRGLVKWVDTGENRILVNIEGLTCVYSQKAPYSVPPEGEYIEAEVLQRNIEDSFQTRLELTRWRLYDGNIMFCEDKYELARKIEEELEGVTISVWLEFLHNAIYDGIYKALQFAEEMSKSQMVSVSKRYQFEKIAETLRKFETQLLDLEREDVIVVLGLVSYCLEARRRYGVTEK